ncbi:MAG: ligase [Pirellulaceae bacterium]|nr:MAG: ligase [Pirellulaceae bacterium]
MRKTDDGDNSPLRRWMWLRRLLVASLGASLIWAWITPADAVEVFRGAALPQNFLWLAMAVGTAFLQGHSADHATASRGQFLCAVGLVAWLATGATLAGAENNPRTAWLGFWHVLALGAWYYTASRLVAMDRSLATGLCLLLVAAGCGLAAYGLYQLQVVLPSLQEQFEQDPDGMLASINQFAPEGSPERARYRARLYSPEPYATFALANSLAVALSIPLLLVIGALGKRLQRMLAATAARGHASPGDRWQAAGDLPPPCREESEQSPADGGRRQPDGGGRPMLDRCLVPMGGALVGGTILWCWLETRSRGAWLAVLTALVLVPILSRWWMGKPGHGPAVPATRAAAWHWWTGPLIVLLMLGGILMIVRSDELVLREAPKSLAFRIEYWIATSQMIADYGWRGVGLGNFQNYYPHYKSATASEEIADPHNWILDWMVSLSVIAAGGLLGWLAGKWVALQRCLDSETSPRQLPTPSLATEQTAKSTVGEAALQGERWLWQGALGGGALILIGTFLLRGADLPAHAVAWLGGGLGGWVLRSWRADLARFPSLVMALVAVAIALLAAGSWQAPGIALPFLAVLAVVAQPVAEPPTAARRQSWLAPRHAAIAWTAMLGAFLGQCWYPVTRCWGLLQKAEVETNLEQCRRYLEAAQRADPWEAEVVARQAMLAVHVALQVSSSRFEAAADHAVAQLDRWTQWEDAAYGTWQAAGEHSFRLAARAQMLRLTTDRWLEHTQRYYRAAIRRYPTNVRLHAQLAVVAAVRGDWPLFERHAEEARRLSDLTPHDDRKLATQLLWFPMASPATWSLTPMAEGFYKAEPLLDALRKMNNGQAPRERTPRERESPPKASATTIRFD